MRTLRSGLAVVALAVAVGVVLAVPAAADPSVTHGQGGVHTNRYLAQACQHGGYSIQVNAETRAVFTNAGDCTSFAVRGGTLGTGEGQLTFTSSATYPCALAPSDSCWGALEMSGFGRRVYAAITQPADPTRPPVIIFSDDNGNYSGHANVPCTSRASSNSTYVASVVGLPSTPAVTGPTCS